MDVLNFVSEFCIVGKQLPNHVALENTRAQHVQEFSNAGVIYWSSR